MSLNSPNVAISKSIPAPSFVRKAFVVARIAGGACLFVVFLLPVWNLAVTKWQHARNPVPGEFYSIEGRQMHLYCTGAGSPSIIIEAGFGSSWIDWQTVQPKLSSLTRICTYDRSGLGWSEPRPGRRDAEEIVHELHALLDRAGVQRPLLLLGHSAGGIYVREYAREFPADIAGVVLIDSSSPRQIDEMPGGRASFAADVRNAAKALWLDKFMTSAGWARLMGSCHDTPYKGLENMAGQYDAQMCRPDYEGADFGEGSDFEAANNQAARLTSFGNLPLLIISEDTDRRIDRMPPDGIAQLSIWAKEQEESKSLSPLSWRVIARGSGHGIFIDRPDVILAEVTRLIRYMRGAAAPPFGSTITE